MFCMLLRELLMADRGHVAVGRVNAQAFSFSLECSPQGFSFYYIDGNKISSLIQPLCFIDTFCLSGKMPFDLVPCFIYIV